MTPKHSLLPALALSIFAAACSSTSASMDVDPSPTEASISASRAVYQPAGDTYTLVMMRASSTLSASSRDELATLTTGHDEFMQGLSDDGYLLASGPIVPPRSDQTLRGMFFLDSSDPADAYGRACNDPATEAGLVEMEAMTFITQADMRAFGVMQRAAAMESSETPRMRRYIAVMAPTSAALTAMLRQMDEAVLYYGHCTTGSLENMTICFLDANTDDEARQMMSVIGPESDAFEYHAWVSSVAIEEMD